MLNHSSYQPSMTKDDSNRTYVCHNCGKELQYNEVIWTNMTANSINHYYDILKFYVPHCSEKCKLADIL
jgi:hypothetical protein